MTREAHTGKRHQRSTGKLTPYSTVRFLIVTDANKTEKNYITGLKKSLPPAIQNRIAIEFKKSEHSSSIHQYTITLKNTKSYYNYQVWILFDCDEVPGFDTIIKEAEESGIRVAWSNPCIEMWFSAHFGNMRPLTQSGLCIDAFKKIYFDKTGIDYKKNDEEIYARLNKYGSEEEACKRAERKRKELIGAGIKYPSGMCPATTVDLLVKEIKSKANCPDE